MVLRTVPAGERTPRRFHQCSIRLLLIALVCVPLAAVGVASGADVANGIRQSDSAARTVAAIRVVAQVDSARAAAGDEILPSLVASFGDDAQVARSYGLSPSVQALVRTAFPASSVRTSQRDAARAIAAVDLRAAPPALASAVEAVPRQQLVAEAAARARRASVVKEYSVQIGLVQALGMAEGDEVDRLLDGNLSPVEQRSLQQLQVVVGLVAAAGDETPAFMATAIGGPRDAPIQVDWLQAWSRYQGAASAASSQLDGSLAQHWGRIENLTTTTRYDALVNPLQAKGHSTPQLLPLLAAANDSFARAGALSSLLHQATAAALAAAVAHRHSIDHHLLVSILDTVGLIALSIAVAILASMAISRPVRRLAEAAKQISRGNLVDIEPSGPSEVRTAGEALGATAANLRRVEAQAADLAAGRLESELLAQPHPGPLGEVVHASVRRIIETIHERQALQSELAHQAAHDPLTALPNRAAALTQIESALARSARSGQMLGLLFVDLDGFKAVNDDLGHAAGDQVLRAVSDRMSEHVRAGDVVCRLGGDEFVVVVEDAESEVAVLQAGQRLIDAISTPLQVGDTEVRVGASIGVAISSDGGGSADGLLSEADAAVYRAKASGRGQVELFDRHLREALHRRTELERAMRLGLARQEFALHYQPVVDVGTGAVKGYEALVRWHRPGHGVVMPDEFIPVAELSGLINELGRWVLLEATAQLRRWTDEMTPGAPPPSVAVNVSGRQLATPQLVDDVTDALAASGVHPSQLTLELTETVLVSDPSCTDRLLALKALGVLVALDDFGTGYTSIGQLGHFPLDVLKIDRSFIAAMATSDQLVQMMIQMAHTFSLAVVAEGVEDPGQLEALRQLRCDAAQGYLFARPRPADQLDDASTAYAVAPVVTQA